MSEQRLVRFLPNFGAALRRALQWRLLLLWVLVTAMPSLLMTLPVWQFLSRQFDHSVHSGWWANNWDIVMLSDLREFALRETDAMTGTGLAAIGLLGVTIPFLSSVFIAASRAVSSPKMGELIHEGLRHYWPMLRLTILALIPLAIALKATQLMMKGVNHYQEPAILASNVDRLRWAAFALSGLMFAAANAWIDAGRASMALNTSSRSAVRAWWRGLKLLVRHPLRSLVLYWVILATAAMLLALVAMLRVELHSTGRYGFYLGLGITQIMVAIVAWMHFARLFAMAELSKALRPATPTSAG